MKVVKVICGLLMFIGFCGMLFTAGASDLDLISFGTIIGRLLLSLIVGAVGFIGYRATTKVEY